MKEKNHNANAIYCCVGTDLCFLRCWGGKFSWINFLIMIGLFLFSVAPASAQQIKIKVPSPDGKIGFTVEIVNGQVKYSVDKQEQMLIGASTMGLTVDGKQLGAGTSLIDSGRKRVNKKYQTRGWHSVAVDNHNQLTIKVNGENPYAIEVRTYNNGVAFRYIVQRQGESMVNEELTEFAIPLGSTLWGQKDINYYEGRYKRLSTGEVLKGSSFGPPLTIKLAGSPGYAAICEAGLIDFAGMSLVAVGNGVFKAQLAGPTKKNGAFVTPWRVVLIGSDLNQLVNSDVISNVSAPMDKSLFPKGYDSEWVRPGKSVWSWMASNGPVTFDNMKRFSDWASQLGIAYNLVDEGWMDWKQDGKDCWQLMKELVDYSASKGVKIWVWKAYPDRKGIPGIKDREARLTFFKKCKELGIAGLKIDFFDSEGQDIIQFYQAALRDAAEHKLMLNFHGANKPTGESRTWPNEMSREGILGLEAGQTWPKHTTTLLFTRFLAGHADFTPLAMDSIAKGTTLAHQVAMVAAFTSPFMCLGVDPEKLLKSEVKTIVRDIPVIWDETIILPPSEIGELAVMARRSGRFWYLIALNGDSARSLSVNLGFLGNGKYRSDILTDGGILPNGTTYTKSGNMVINLQSGGGYLARFY